MLLPLQSTQVPHVQQVVIVRKAEAPKPNPDYVIKEGDSLTSISEATGVPLSRLWSANTQLTNPDVLAVADPLKMPKDTDVLPTRELPAIVEVGSNQSSGQSLSPPSGGFSSVNTYTPGQCTAFVKDTLSWVQNGWGDAYSWGYTSGHRVSSIPAVGTIAWARDYGHVAVVISVTGNSVTVREQNYQGPFIISTRVAPISEFEYIYP